METKQLTPKKFETREEIKNRNLNVERLKAFPLKMEKNTKLLKLSTHLGVLVNKNTQECVGCPSPQKHTRE